MLAAASALVLAGATPALAGTYDVRSCASASTLDSSAWVAGVRSGEPIEFADWCQTGQAESDGKVDFTAGRWLRPPLAPPTPTSFATPGLAASLTFVAPAGAALRHVSYRRRLQTLDESWEVRLKADAALIEACIVGLGQFECPELAPDGTVDADLASGTQALQLGTWCVDSVCPYNSGTPYDFAAVIYWSIVTVEENGLPTAGAPAISGLANGWVNAATGSASASMAGSDPLGLHRLELVSDGTVAVAVENTACVDWSVLPCSDTSVPGLGPGFGGSASLAGVADGIHEVRTRATDAAGNQSLSSPVTVKVDRTAPVPLLIAAGGVTSGATTTVESLLRTDLGSPLVAGRLKICSGQPTPTTCRWQTGPTQGKYTVDLGVDGDLTTIQLELTDEAGNSALSPATEYRRDSTAPAAPQLAVVPGSGAKRAVTVATDERDIAAYLVRICDNAGCTETRRPASGRADLDFAAPATYRIEVGLIDAAGNIGGVSSTSIDYPPTKLDDPKKPTALALKKPRKLRSRATVIDLSGTVAVGSTSKIRVTVKGRPAGGKPNVTYKATAKVSKSGRWTARVKLPRGVSRRHGVLVTVVATPTNGYLAATVSRRIRG